MSIRPMSRNCVPCGKPIPSNPSAGKFATFCPRCLTFRRSIPGGHLPKTVHHPRSPRRKP